MMEIDLRGPRLRVRRARRDDAAASFGWFADPEVTRYLPLAGKSALPMASIQAHLEQAESSDRPKLSVTFDFNSQGSVGCGGFRNFEAGSAEISIVIGVPSLWGRGLGAEAFELLLAFGFGELELTTIWLVVRADNIPALKLFRMFDFEVVELQSAAAIIDGQAIDKLKMQLTRGKYESSVGGSNKSV